jgi:hypothetical protein
VSGFERPDPTLPPRPPEPFPWVILSIGIAAVATGFLLVWWAVKLAARAIHDNGVQP